MDYTRLKTEAEIRIKSAQHISFSTSCAIVSKYCDLFQESKVVENKITKQSDTFYILKQHVVRPATIKLDGRKQEFFVKCYRSKTEYVFEISYYK